MGIDVGSANARAKDLRDCANELRQAQNNLAQYKNHLSNNWQAAETNYFFGAIGGVETQLNQAALELESIAGDIVSTANAIKREEEERARREAEERARREAEERARREAEEQAKRDAQELAAAAARNAVQTLTKAVSNSIKRKK